MVKRRTRSGIEKHPPQDELHLVDDDNGDGSENIFSKALLSLSLKERNQIEEEIHGVSCMAIQETPELIEEALREFNYELDFGIADTQKISYQKAKENICSNSNTIKAVSRYVNYLDLLLYQVYGDYALRRPIQLLQDFNKEELLFLKSGQYQLLPYRDRSGRRIMAFVPNNKDHVPIKVLLKVFLYLWYVVVGGDDISNNDSNNIETQRKGIIIVIFPSGRDVYNINNDNNQNYNSANNSKDNNYQSVAQWTKNRLEANTIIAKVVPLRVASIHICLSNSNKFQLLSSIYGIILKRWNARVRIHLGNPLEIRYKLQQYGVPIELIPSTDTGNIKSVNLKQWMNLRIHLERERQKSAYYYSSSDNDSDNNGGCGGYDSGDISSSSITTSSSSIVTT